MNVVTYQSSRGLTIDICPQCEKRFKDAQDWPRDWAGEDYCSVSHGLHKGSCDVHEQRPGVAADG